MEVNEEVKHTAGPWSVQFARRDTMHTIYGASGTGEAIGTVNGWRADALANARLIAAAPDLLEAGQAKSTRSYAQFKAAISKATQTPENPHG